MLPLTPNFAPVVSCSIAVFLAISPNINNLLVEIKPLLHSTRTPFMRFNITSFPKLSDDKTLNVNMTQSQGAQLLKWMSILLNGLQKVNLEAWKLSWHRARKSHSICIRCLAVLLESFNLEVRLYPACIEKCDWGNWEKKNNYPPQDVIDYLIKIAVGCPIFMKSLREK